MSGDEFRTRLAQASGKRLEYASFRAGFSSEPRINFGKLDDTARFFFSHAELTSRVTLIQQYLPEALSETVEEAEEILRHRFRLLGYRDLDYGKEIDWHLDAVHGKRTPLKPWYKIQFLDFDEVGDHKVTWELNRHQHLITLAKACVFTGNRKYVEEIERQFYSWRKANPYPIGINWGSSLEVAFRSLSWIWVRQLLGASLSADFDHDLARGLARHGTYIERYLSTYFSPNTHLLGEALALYFIGTLCLEISAATRWRSTGLEILTKEIQRQVRPDGVYFEQSLYYHVYALDMFLHARALAAANGAPVPNEYNQALQRMLCVLDALCRNGPPQGFGDDDGGRLFDPRRNRSEHMADPLALGAALFDDVELPSGKLTEESIWIFGERAVARSNQNAQITALPSRAFEDGGLYVISSAGPRRSQMLVDAGPHGIGHGGHGHADALSIRLSIGNSPCLVDPGAYIYVSPGDDRNLFRGTAAHNTVRVDGVDQAVPETPFSWSSIPEVTTEQWETGQLFTFFSGSHTGYQRLSDPAQHRRAIFHLHGEYWFVRDVLVGATAHDLEIFWHFAPDAQLMLQNDILSAKVGDLPITIFSASSSPWSAHIEEGFVSPAYGDKQPAPVGVFRSRQALPAEHASLLIPDDAVAGKSNFLISSLSNPVCYGYKRDEVEDQLIFSSHGNRWTQDAFTSDADFFFVRRERGEITMLVFLSASFVEIAGQPLFSPPSKVQRFEWSSTSGASTSDPQSLKFFYGQLIRAGNPVR